MKYYHTDPVEAKEWCIKWGKDRGIEWLQFSKDQEPVYFKNLTDSSAIEMANYLEGIEILIANPTQKEEVG